MRFIFALMTFTNPAWAACEVGEKTFMSCQTEDGAKILRVCFDDTTTHYRFGAVGQPPELVLSEPIETVDYTPWPGAGQSIWEEIRFRNGDYLYEVHAGFERMFDEEEYNATPHHGFGGVRVTRGEAEIAALACVRATVDFSWDTELFDAKSNLGYVWDDRTREWTALPD